MTSKIKVLDPFGAAADPQMPTLALALDPAAVKREFKRGLPRLGGEVAVKSITVTRHKPGRRCVLEYDVRVERDGIRVAKATLIGKVRAKRFGNEACRLLEAIRNAGFAEDSHDGISVPEPVGVIPQFQMWLQRKVCGVGAAELLIQPEGLALARQIAEALHKLHCAGVPATRAHSMTDELRILHERLPLVAQIQPGWSQRVARLLHRCDQIGAGVPRPAACGIHRDFYAAQVIVHGPRLYLLDFDLYCRGDPGLDAGNFLGHITEESLRTLGDADALKDREQALEERFVELSGPPVRPAVRAYAALTLVRHIYLSTQFPERRFITERLMDLCEERLAQLDRGIP